MSEPSARARLGSFEVDLRTGELRPLEQGSSASAILLREQPFQILRMLIDRGGKIVTRAEIKKALWPNDTIVDFDHSINVAIGVLRRALGDSAASPRYIETLGRRGYRLLTVVDWVRTGSAANGTAVASQRAAGDLLGRKVGHYRVIEVLGGGGMGMVYKAEDLKLGRQVALKFLPEELASDPIALARLEGEARTASGLNHPNICTIFDIEEYAGQKFIAMELLEGETLLERIAASAPDPLPRLEVLDIAVQACAGLEAAHERGVVHRDVKPGNIFLTRQGPVKILDFGVAKLVATGDRPNETEVEPESEPGLSSAIQLGLTRTGASVGTRGYMSPEQVRKEPLDARSDLFSLGLVLYEMVTGRRAFTDGTPTGIQERGTDAPVPRPREFNADIPRALDATIGKALEIDPARRYQTAAEMRRDLERIRHGARSPDRQRLQYVLAAAVLVALGVSAVWFWRVRSTVTLAPDDTIVIAHLTNETSNRVFNEALYTGLRVALEQTPYLNVLADSKVHGELKALSLADSTPVTPQIALEICRRTGSKIVVAPSIADAGNRLRLELTGLDCRSGARIAHVEREAASRDAVIHALGLAAAEMRTRLGEPSASVARFNVSLDEATSASPEAVELLTLGYRRHLSGDLNGAIPYYERAISADPNFSLAYAALAVADVRQGQTMLAVPLVRRAFELRERLTQPARFNVESAYYIHVTHEEDAACEVIAQWVQTFPHDLVARQNFSTCLSDLGEPDRALGQAREAARLLPAPWTYQVWVERALDADRLDEARSAYEESLRRGFDSPGLRDRRVLIAFLEKDEPTMLAQWKWAEGKAGAEPALLIGRAMSEAYHGRLRAARDFAKRIAALNAKQGGPPGDAWLLSMISLIRAEAGVREDPSAATGAEDEPFERRVHAALTLARAGKIDQARKVADRLRREFPSHTLLQKYCLPVIDGAVKLESNDPAGAIEALRPAAKYELTGWPTFPSLYAAYLSGLAWLKMGDGKAAAAEFRKVLAHPGLVGRLAIGAIAHLQLARAEHLSGQDAAALPSYEEFLGLWKDADDDLPLYNEARAEYRRLRSD